MTHAGGPVVPLFENTWMRACGLGALQPDGSRRINKMGNMDLLVDVDDERRTFDSAVIDTIRKAIPEFNSTSLNAFYRELMRLTNNNDESLVRRGISSTLSKMAAEDLLLSGALSGDSPFFTKTILGKAIRDKGIKTYGIIELAPELDLSGHAVVVNYPPKSDPDFELLNDMHLPNHDLSVNITSKPISVGIFYYISMVLGAGALVIAFTSLNLASLGSISGLVLAVCGGLTFLGGVIGLFIDQSKNLDHSESEDNVFRP